MPAAKSIVVPEQVFCDKAGKATVKQSKKRNDLIFDFLKNLRGLNNHLCPVLI
jgi:hypothetical protein